MREMGRTFLCDLGISQGTRRPAGAYLRRAIEIDRSLWEFTRRAARIRVNRLSALARSCAAAIDGTLIDNQRVTAPGSHSKNGCSLNKSIRWAV